MNAPAHQAIRTIVAAADEGQLNELMITLFRAQAHICGAEVSKIAINTNTKASDDGCDGWTPQPKVADEWLKDANICWQLKSGVSGQPQKLKGEVTKPIPADTLRKGGWFVVVASACTDGQKGVNARVTVLKDEATSAGLPTDKILVMDASQIESWILQHPAISMPMAGMPQSLVTLSDWARLPFHAVEWQETDETKQVLEKLGKDIDFIGGNCLHLHIKGQPGVGKSRFALELCKRAGWSEYVLYARQVSDVNVADIVGKVAANKSARLILALDEVPLERLASLRDDIARADGRARLVTIGHSASPDAARIPAYEIKPLSNQLMTKIITGWHPSFPPEHTEFCVQFSAGFVRLGMLSSNAIATSSAKDAIAIVKQPDIRGFLNRMLGAGDHSSLHVVAALAHIGWTGDREIEGKTVAEHLGLKWDEVCRDVKRYDDNFGIAPRGGRLRYISPTPLGIYLAIDAWETYPQKMHDLREALPTEEAREAYDKRFEQIISSPHAKKFAREELLFFSKFDAFLPVANARRWSILAIAEPALSAKKFFHLCRNTSREQRLQLDDRARRYVISGLEKLIWKPESFKDSIMSLVLMAEAETEKWSNNATGQFVSHFQIWLGGTSVAYPLRLEALREILSWNIPDISRIVIQALAKAGETHVSRIGDGRAIGILPDKEWQPTTYEEYLSAVKMALVLLTEITLKAEPMFEAQVVSAANCFAMLLRVPKLRPAIDDFYRRLSIAYPNSKETLRKGVADIILRERKYWKEIPESEIAPIQALHDFLIDNDFFPRLSRIVGSTAWGEDEREDVTPIAAEIFKHADLLTEHWDWLISGEAHQGWMLGEALAKLDMSASLLPRLLEMSHHNKDMRLVTGYISGLKTKRDNIWYQGVLRLLASPPTLNPRLLFEVVWRCGISDDDINIIIEFMHTHTVDAYALGGLGFGRWMEEIKKENLLPLLKVIRQQGHLPVVIDLLDRHIRQFPKEIEWWHDFALSVVTEGQLIRSHNMPGYHWKSVALLLVKQHAGELAGAIFREHSNNEASHWMIEYNDAAKVIDACCDENPISVWEQLKGHLQGKNSALFSIGFPEGLLDKIPVANILSWIEEAPSERAAAVVRLASKNIIDDSSLTSQLLEKFSSYENVTQAIFSKFASGSWSGSSSAHWEGIASMMERVAASTELPQLRSWALSTSVQFRQWSISDGENEDEEEVGRQ